MSTASRYEPKGVAPSRFTFEDRTCIYPAVGVPGKIIVRGCLLSDRNGKISVAPAVVRDTPWTSREDMLKDLSVSFGVHITDISPKSDELPALGSVHFTVPVVRIVKGLLRARKDRKLVTPIAGFACQTVMLDAVLP